MRVNLPRFHKLAIGCVLCSFSFATAVYSAVTFDEMPPVEYRVIQNGYAGLQWNNFFIENATNGAGFLPGMVSSPDVAFNGSGHSASVSSSTPFNLGSAYLTGAYGGGMQLRIRGYTGNTVLYDNTYALSGSAPTLINFNYADVDRVTFDPVLSSKLFAMDNLSLAISGTNTGCTFTIAPDNRQHMPGPESGSVSVFAPGGCPWNVSNTNAWVTITSALNNTNDGSVTYTVSPNVTGVPRAGFITIAGQAFSVTQFALGGTNLTDFGVVQSPTVGHYFYEDYYGYVAFVGDTLVDQDQSSGGGGVLPSVSANFDTNNQFVLTVSAPPGYKFFVHPPPGKAVRFGGGLTWQSGFPSGASRYGTLAVGFGGLEGTAPDFSASRTVLSDYHRHFGFNDIQSTAFTNNLAFSSMTLTATVPSLNTGSATLSYNPYSSDGQLLLYYTTSATSDPGSFVSIVPAIQPTVSLMLQPNGDVTIIFAGTLQSASDVPGNFSDVPGNPQGTHTIPKASLLARQYFRARN